MSSIPLSHTLVIVCRYTSRIAPWVHYVPVQISYADLYDALAFFREHDAAAERIAREGKEWSRNFWRKEDMAAYLYRCERASVRVCERCADRGV